MTDKFCVDRWLDQVKIRPESIDLEKRYDVFDTQREAYDYVVARANRLRKEAEYELGQAEKRFLKCRRKYK